MMCLLNGKAVGLERAHMPVYGIDINISIHTGLQYTHKHTCSSGKGSRQNGLVVIDVPALQCSKNSIKFSCPMRRELLALDLLVLPSW